MEISKESQVNKTRIIPKQGDRGEFPTKVRKQIIDDQGGQCQICGRLTTHIHHVMPRGRGGRGVYTNGLLACDNCHIPKIHEGPFLQYYIDLFIKRFGADFYKDEWDKESERGIGDV
jgi:hypothetical protein